jgi:hypothetical protein
LPKGIKIIATDFYFVWSEHMKNELQYYYPDIKESQIFITGTPQFEPHYEKQFLNTKEVFFNQNGLDLSKKYICFSGDDVTTSPNDPHYLLDVAKAVEQLNAKGHNLGIIFRRCPVDFSNRYDFVSEKYADDNVLKELVSLDYFLSHKVKPKSIFIEEIDKKEQNKIAEAMKLNSHQFRYAMLPMSFNFEVFKTENKIENARQIVIVAFSGTDYPKIERAISYTATSAEILG